MNRIVEKAVASISSLRLSVVCLLYCAIIVIAGTFYQVDNGLWAAQERFFRSWVFFIAGFLPLPGLQSVLAVVLANLLIAGIKKIPFRFKNLGLLLMHFGVIVLIAGAGLSTRFVKESSIMIGKRQRVNESVDLRRWDLSITINGVEDDAFWTSSYNGTLSSLKQGRRIQFPKVKKEIIIKRLYKNCQARGRGAGAIDSLLPIPSPSGGIVPGLVLVYGDNVQQSENNPDMLVYGGAGEPVPYPRKGDTIIVSLLPARVMLPLTITMVDLVIEKHPGTSNLKKIQSRIRVTGEDIDREVVISMNRPFRYHSLTFYQTGYSDEPNAPRSSTITVVENPFRFLPHGASVMIMFGLLFHFGLRFFAAIKVNRRKKNG